MPQYYSGPISGLPPALGPVLSSNLYPATDITDLTQSPAGSTKKYSIAQLQQFLVGTIVGSNIQSAYVATTGSNLNAAYSNGDAGVGATLTNTGTLSAITIDSITLTIGNRVLVKDQTAAYENGVYVVTTVGDNVSIPWVLTRAPDYDGSIRVPMQGDFIGIVTGSQNQLTFWFQTAPGPIIVGTSTLTFQESMGEEFGFNWVYLSTTSVTASVNTGYVIGNSALTTITLPSVANIGETIIVQGSGASGWVLQCNTGQFINMGDISTSSGGSLSSGNRYDTIEIVCIFPNTLWSAGYAVSAGLTIV
jgi:hypothetical protein